MTTVLRIYLVLVFLANLGGMATLLLGLEAILSRYPKLGYGLVAVLVAAGVASLVAVVLMWRWRRSGLVLIAAAYAAMLAVNLYYGAPLAHTLLGPIGLGVLFALVWPVRGRFRRQVV